MPDIHEKLLTSMTELKIGQAEISGDLRHIKKDIKLSHIRISKIAERTDDLESWRDEESGKAKAWKIISVVVISIAAVTTILAFTGVLHEAFLG